MSGSREMSQNAYLLAKTRLRYSREKAFESLLQRPYNLHLHYLDSLFKAQLFAALRGAATFWRYFNVRFTRLQRRRKGGREYFQLFLDISRLSGYSFVLFFQIHSTSLTNAGIRGYPVPAARRGDWRRERGRPNDQVRSARRNERTWGAPKWQCQGA